MRWEDREISSNVEDRRGGDSSSGFSGGGGGRSSSTPSLGAIMMFWPLIRPLLKTKFGWTLIAIGGFLYFMGINPLNLVNGNIATNPTTHQTTKTGTLKDKEARFIATVLRDTEVVWHEIFREFGQRYKEPKLVLFRGATHSACGMASAQIGPFYCPADQKVYIDLDFFDELARNYNASGDFAEAYVLAHEVGHHVQNMLGILDKAQTLKHAARSQRDENRVQVKVELQADCFAGVWANRAEKRFHMLEEGDIEEALNTASAIGDDTLQKRAQGYVVPDSFTHGSSAQRVYWFKRGFETGDIRECNTI
jgi:predicted metalloprotease